MAYAPRIQTKQHLRDYILRQLGSPVVNIEITQDQLDDAIDNALELFMTNAFSGVVEKYLTLSVEAGKQEYELPYDVYAILKVMNKSKTGFASGSTDNIFSMGQYIASDLYRGLGKVNLLSYELTNQLIATIDDMFNVKVSYDFNVVSKILRLHEIPTADETMMLHCYVKNVPTYTTNPVQGEPDIESTNIYNELIVRNLATSYGRRQWADNLSKYAGSALPNGLNIDVPTLMNRANEDVLKYETELHECYEIPPMFIVGSLALFFFFFNMFTTNLFI